MKKSAVTFALVMFLTFPANAGMFDGPGTLVKMINEYVGRPVQELIAVIGSPNDQKQVLDDIILHGGFSSEEGPSCEWKVTIDAQRIVKSASVFGNPWGCRMIVKDMKKAIAKQTKSPES